MAQLVRIGDVLHLPNDRFGRRLRPILTLIDSVHGLATPHRLPVRITRNRDNEGEYH